jgi:cardiolipin synthase
MTDGGQAATTGSTTDPATDPTSGSGEDRILTVPNFLSLVRLACIPLFLWLLFSKHERYAAAWLLGALGATDWVDGYVARHFNQVSRLGKVLDPTADRLLLGVGVIAILIDGSVPPVVAWAVIVREIAVSVAVLGLAAAGAARIDVTWVGKAGTFCNLFAFPFFLAGNSDVFWHRAAHWLGWTFAVPGLLLSYYAAALYVPLARQALRDGHSRRVGEMP